MADSLDWYWRMQMGFPARSEDREVLRRIAPELFVRDLTSLREPANEQQLDWRRSFRKEVRDWLETSDDRRRVTVHEGSCPQHDCPLQLNGKSGQVLGDNRLGMQSTAKARSSLSS
jgi:hypothetical protein